MFCKLKVCLTTCFQETDTELEKETKVGSYEFSRNQKIVTDSFPWSRGMQPKNCYPWDLKS